MGRPNGGKYKCWLKEEKLKLGFFYYKINPFYNNYIYYFEGDNYE